MSRSVHPGRRLLLLAIGGLAPLLLAAPCAVPRQFDIDLTLNGIPASQNDILIVPPSGFTIDVHFSDPTKVVPGSLSLTLLPMPGDGIGGSSLLPFLVYSGPDGAAALIPEGQPLTVGSHRILAEAKDLIGHNIWVLQNFAVREHTPPLDTPNWIQLDFEFDRDGDTFADFDDDLETLGLGQAGAPGPPAIVRDWVIAEIVARAGDFYALPNPSALPAGDASELSFSDLPAPTGPTTRICIGGEDPLGGITLGNVAFDPGNTNDADVACDNVLPSGVFPRELVVYGAQPAFQAAFGAVLLDPVGNNALDPVVLGPGYDPGDPQELARFTEIENAVIGFAQAIATITAHEAGHAVGLVPKGEPGRGLFGGEVGAEIAHNLEPGGGIPVDNLLMNKGASFSFASLTGAQGQPLPRLRELNHAYLRGRLVLDPKVTGIFAAPHPASVGPQTISLSGPFTVTIAVFGTHFMATPTLQLQGPTVFDLISLQFISSQEVRGDAIALMPFLQPGVYDLQVKNPDGQLRVLDNVISVVP